MVASQGDPILLNDPIARELLNSTEMAELAYIWRDGTPRVVPLWFHWNGEEVVFGTFPTAPKVHAIEDGTSVAVTIDSRVWPYRVLSMRGKANVRIVDGVAVEYALAAVRYFGEDQGQQWVATMGELFPQMARIAVVPDWVAILDFEQRFPGAVTEAMSRAAQA